MLQYLKLLAITTVLLVVYTVNLKAQESRQGKQLFDSNWKFFLGDPPAVSTVNFDDKNWRNLDLPHDWSIEGTPDKDNPMGTDGGYFLRALVGIGNHLPFRHRGRRNRFPSISREFT